MKPKKRITEAKLIMLEAEGLFLNKLIDKTFIKKVNKIRKETPSFAIGLIFGEKKDGVFLLESPKPEDIKKGVCAIISTNRALSNKIYNIIISIKKQKKKGKR